MPIDKADIINTAFRAGSSGLNQFSLMPFCLSSSRCSFCHVIKTCLGNQQFITLLLYLCLFIFYCKDQWDLNHIEMVFNRLNSFNLKIKLKIASYFSPALSFQDAYYQQLVQLTTQCKFRKLNTGQFWLVRRTTFLLGLAPYCHQFISEFAAITKCSYQLISHINSKK